MEPYKTVQREAEAEFEVKRSRFLCHVCPVSSVPEAEAFLARTRTEHWDARHNVAAYSLRSGQQHCSDDGEPSGTAGRPVLGVLTARGVTDVCVVITRYFGGILLGTGGLVRAYSRGAEQALDAGGILYMEPSLRCRLQCSYAFYGRFPALLAEAGGSITDTDFSEQVSVTYFLPKTALESFEQKLADASAGQCHAAVLEEAYCAVPMDPVPPTEG